MLRLYISLPPSIVLSSMNLYLNYTKKIKALLFIWGIVASVIPFGVLFEVKV